MKCALLFALICIALVCSQELSKSEENFTVDVEDSTTIIPYLVPGYKESVDFIKDGERIPDSSQEAMKSNSVIVLGSSLEGPSKVQLGNNATFNCSSSPEYDMEDLEVEWKFPNYTKFDETLTFGFYSTLLIQPSSKFNGESVTCKIHHATLNETIVKEMLLEVEFPPKRLTSRKTEKDSELIFACNTTASNPAATINWNVNGSESFDGFVKETRYQIKSNKGYRVMSELAINKTSELVGVNATCTAYYQGNQVAEQTMKIISEDLMTNETVDEAFKIESIIIWSIVVVSVIVISMLIYRREKKVGVFQPRA